MRPDETAYPLEARARSYLAVNCSHCHRTGGTAAPSAWDGRAELTLAQTGLLNGLANNNAGNPTNKLVVPGDTLHSVVWNRIAATNGFSRMPPIASAELDQTNITLIADWITQALPARQSFEQWQVVWFGSTNNPNALATSDPDGDGRSNRDEYLAGTNPLDGGSFPALHASLTGASISLNFNLPTNRSPQIETSTNLQGWNLWDVSGNAGLPSPGGLISISGTLTNSQQFFRLRIREN